MPAMPINEKILLTFAPLLSVAPVMEIVLLSAVSGASMPITPEVSAAAFFAGLMVVESRMIVLPEAFVAIMPIDV